MRFEDRLRTEFKVEPEAANACLPSMLLQPLVENAIKYAVSPQEEGASITLSARLVGRRLRVAVSDSGPGLRDGGGGSSVRASFAGKTVSTGVGLANIRDRLQQAYGEDHRFEIRNPPEGGFTVIIEIPYEPVTKPAPAMAAASSANSPPTFAPSSAPAIGTNPA